MKAKQRMYLVGNRDRLVEEGHADAAYLYASIGDTLPDSAVDKFKSVDGYMSKAARATASRAATTVAGKKAAKKAAAEKKVRDEAIDAALGFPSGVKDRD